MLIKGVHNDKARRGDAIELEPKDKFAPAAIRGARTLNEMGKKVFVVDGAEQGILMTKTSWMAMGKPPGYKWDQYNTYLGEGEANMRTITYVDGKERVGPVKKTKFQVKFQDSLDMGQPDIKIESFTLL